VEEAKLLGKKEAAARLGVSTRTLDRERSAGRLRAVRVRGRILFNPDNLAVYITVGTFAGTAR
jgi:excisionase family DNA binding protein